MISITAPAASKTFVVFPKTISRKQSCHGKRRVKRPVESTRRVNGFGPVLDMLPSVPNDCLARIVSFSKHEIYTNNCRSKHSRGWAFFEIPVNPKGTSFSFFFFARFGTRPLTLRVSECDFRASYGGHDNRIQFRSRAINKVTCVRTRDTLYAASS